ncbi:hypothetical protein KY348_06850 [Candidatus Woesearchaeota archaeon]|nr:hypothetical protein [Candidatus Woesearchaeota archaeon]
MLKQENKTGLDDVVNKAFPDDSLDNIPDSVKYIGREAVRMVGQSCEIDPKDPVYEGVSSAFQVFFGDNKNYLVRCLRQIMEFITSRTIHHYLDGKLSKYAKNKQKHQGEKQ